jgi:hypothetical protein
MTCEEFKSGLKEKGVIDRALDHRSTNDKKASSILNKYNKHMRKCEACRNLGLIYGTKFAINPNIL